MIHILSYMDRIVSEVYCIWTECNSLSIYEKIRIQFCKYIGKYGWEKGRILAQCYTGFLTRPSTKISLCLKIARCKEVSALKKVHYRGVLPCDEFIIQQFSIHWTCVRYFDRDLALFNFCIQIMGLIWFLGIKRS